MSRDITRESAWNTERRGAMFEMVQMGAARGEEGIRVSPGEPKGQLQPWFDSPFSTIFGVKLPQAPDTGIVSKRTRRFTAIESALAKLD